RGRPEPGVGWKGAAQAAVAGGIITEGRGIARGELPGCRRALTDDAKRGAPVLLEAGTHFQVRQRAAVDLVGTVQFRPGFRILHIGVLVAEYPTEGDRDAVRGRRGVVGAAQVVTRGAVH